jgi:HlyD family secretion protein
MVAALRQRTGLLFLWCGLALGILVCVSGCHKQQKTGTTASASVITAQAKATVTALHFNGPLGPLSSQSILSPLEGRVTQVLFEYGQQINKGQAVITMDASKLAEEYRKTVSDFLEKKQTYETGIVSYQGTEALYKAGVISKEEYLTASNRQKSDTLSFYQAKYDLEKLLPQTSVSFKTIEELNLTDLSKAHELLNKQFKELKIFSPVKGVALFPSSDQKKEGSGNGRISVGDDLKVGQLILSVGDLSGFSMKVNVSEISINLIKKDLPAKITGSAFPGITLNGYVSSVASQSNPTEGGEGGLGMFEVRVNIPDVSPEQRRIIRVGMSGTVELDIPEPPQIFLPIRAVFQKDNKTMVTVVDKDGQRRDVVVITGKTTLTEVAIVKGISPGDQVVVPH